MSSSPSRPLENDSLSVFATPVELIQRILTLCHPCDVAAFAMTCHLAYNTVYGSTDQFLWRQLFLLYPFDDLIIPNHHSLIDWKAHLVRRMSAELAARSSASISIDKACDALQTMVSVTEQLSAVKDERDTLASKDLKWMEEKFRSSTLLAISLPREAAHLQARLRSYFMLCSDARNSTSSHVALLKRRALSRVSVYCLRNYRPETRWGPLLSSGDVNWIHIEHLVTVILTNLYELPAILPIWRPRLSLESIRPHSAPGVHSSRDWAGVAGTWRRYICFMDYRDLYAFNFAENPCDHNFFEDPRFREATRLIEVKLRLVTSDSLRCYSPLDPLTASEPEFEQSRPTLYFTGTTRGSHGNEAGLEGFVKWERPGYIFWQFTAIYDNLQRWTSCGIQIGGAASATGIIGVWTTSAHEGTDPAGPFWLWKVDDDYSNELLDYT
ncbi:hypothetical protein AX17_000416 [Amanita inopinata Kibby_2008]|nr:hypothetical protein AX17_000416 [Amanita inopinata Kibby_2008]